MNRLGSKGLSLDSTRIELSLRGFLPILCEGQKRLREATYPSVASPLSGSTALLSCLGAAALLLACDNSGAAKKGSPPAAPDVSEPSPPQAVVAKEKAPSAAAKDSDEQPEAPPEPACPPKMNRIPGGRFQVGNEHKTYEYEENPRFSTRLPDFCAMVMEVSAAEYESCVEAGKCTPSHAHSKTCNTVAKGRGDHPINCIDHSQATQICKELGGRLPTEVEWEYLARGGEEMRPHPWGPGPVDGKTCWKSHQSCVRGSFAEGAFGLHDVVGNVWEWTDSWFGPYPWPQAEGRHKVYRGGSWSRRFEKWMRPTLRNRLDPEKFGSHLGVRCVADLPSAACPYGRDPSTGRCAFGLDSVDCLDGREWNGLRCAKPGDPNRCAPGTEEIPGSGCVRKRVAGAARAELDTGSVVRSRSPQFDADCRENSPSRPNAYRLTGGGHLARNLVGKQNGCKNRDVGVGWNSACCP